MPLLEQIAALRSYMRTLQADVNRASREQSEHWRKRRISPFVHSLRFQRIAAAYELLEMGEECLSRLRRARAIAIAEFIPGDVVNVTTVLAERELPPERFAIFDVKPVKRDDYHYEVWQLTKAGRLFERGPTGLSRSRAVQIERSMDRLPEPTREQCERFASEAQTFVEGARDRGRLEEVLKVVRERGARRSW